MENIDRMKEMQNLNKVSLREKWSYAIGSLGNNIIYGLMATYLIVFYTDYFGIPAGTIATLFLVARIWDAINDPVMGIVVDNTHTKMGKFRPYLLFVPFIMGLMTILTFTAVPFSQTGRIIWAFVTYIGWGMSFTAMDIPYWSMSAAITQNQKERNTIVMLSRTIATIGYFIAAVFVLPIVEALGNNNQAWMITAIIFAVLSVVFTLITFFNVKERTVSKNSDRQSFGHVINMLTENRPLRLIVIGLFTVEAGNNIKTILPFYYLTYNLGRGDMMPVFLGVYALFTVFGSVISPYIVNFIGKKNTVISSIALLGISGVAHYFIGYGSFIMVVVMIAIGAFAFGIANIVLMSMLADAVDYGEWKTGRRSEGMIFSTNIFKTKLASALGGFVGAMTLSIFGYVQNAQQSIETLNGFHFSISLLPSILVLFALIPFFSYDLTEDKYQEIIKELESRG